MESDEISEIHLKFEIISCGATRRRSRLLLIDAWKLMTKEHLFGIQYTALPKASKSANIHKPSQAIESVTCLNVKILDRQFCFEAEQINSKF
jgi:hypothetical protein